MKNVRSFVMNCVLVALVVLMLGFMAGEYVGWTGYQLLDWLQYTEYLDASAALLAVSTLLVLLFILVIAVLAVVGMLCDFGVIKSQKVAKCLKLTEMVLGCLAFAFTMISLIVAGVEAGTVGWGLILNFIVALGLVAVPVVDLVLAHKKK